jgi:ABC-type multidrug transport system fused ATPase/permease subunit
MNSNFKLSKDPSFEDNTSWFSFIFMFYLDALFMKGISKPLGLSDLGGIREADKSSELHIKFNIAWNDAIEKSKLTSKKPNLWSILWKTMGYSKFIFSFALFFISAVIQFGPVFILNRLVSYFEGSITFSDEWLWTLVSMLFIFPIIISITIAHSCMIMAHCGAQVRNVLIGVIYRKSLSLSSASRKSVSTGRIITMFSENTNQIRMFIFLICNTIIAPFQIAACLWLLYNQVGISAFIGFAFIIVTIPLNNIVFVLINKLRKEKLIFTDQRVKLMNELLAGIRIIKYYAWEKAFNEKITSIRNSELLILKKSGYIYNVAMSLLLLSAPTIQSILIFFTYTELGNKLDAATAFTTVSLFNMMIIPFMFLPYGLQQYSQTLVSTARIMEFLLVDDQEEYIDKYEKNSNDPIQYSIKIENASMSWMSNAEIIEAEKTFDSKEKDDDVNEVNKLSNEKFDKKIDSNYSSLPVGEEVNKDIGNSTDINRNIYTLSDISVNIKEGSLVAIVGSVGSGKSSFLATVLGEMNKTSGSVSMLNNMNYAYCDQRPWIVNASIKNNILFGKEYNEKKFNNAIYSACMTDDLKIFADGVHTEIGERGVNMSGGKNIYIIY